MYGTLEIGLLGSAFGAAGTAAWAAFRYVSRARRNSRIDNVEAERLNRRSWYDEATGLPNRRFFAEKLLVQLARAERRGAVPIGLVYAELRDHRRLLEQYGQDRVNRLIRRFARQISHNLSGGDMLARLSSNSLIMSVGEREGRTTQAVLGAFRAQLSTPLQDGGETFRFTWGIGSSRHPEHGRSAQELIREATRIHSQVGGEGRSRGTSAATTRSRCMLTA